jgi:NAD(P) transhydrogenase subunit alpha
MANMPARVALHASQMYSNNLTNLIDEFWNQEKKHFELKLEDDIIKSCLITHGGAVVHPIFAPSKKEKKSHKG